MNSFELPEKVRHTIGYEKVDFICHFKSQFPFKDYYLLYVFAFLFFAFPLGLLLAIIVPLFKGENVIISTESSSEIGNWNNLEPLILPLSVISLFVIIGCIILTWSLIKLFKSEGYYIGTEKHLFFFQKNKVESYEWNQVTAINLNVKSRDICLDFRIPMSNSQYFSTKRIYIPAEEDLINIEKICRQRMKENNFILL